MQIARITPAERYSDLIGGIRYKISNVLAMNFRLNDSLRWKFLSSSGYYYNYYLYSYTQYTKLTDNTKNRWNCATNTQNKRRVKN